MENDNNFSPYSRVWIYQSSRPFTGQEITRLNEQLRIFAKQWTAHNAQLKAEARVIEDRIIMLMVDETNTAASGCSIDTSVNFIKSLEKQFGVELFNRNLVNFIKDDSLSTAHLQDLPDMYSSHLLEMDTLVIDPLVTTKLQFDSGFKTPLGKSWMKDFLQ